MKFSIILPTYNVSAYVRKAVLSVLEQRDTCGDFELIIVDDESTDGTWKVVKSFSDNPRVKLYRVSHRGLGAVRNFGVSKATGDYIWTGMMNLICDFCPYYDHAFPQSRQTC